MTDPIFYEGGKVGGIYKTIRSTKVMYGSIIASATYSDKIEMVTTMADTDDNIQRPYKCTIHISLPSNQYAQYLKDVISVDTEISNKVAKSFSIVSASQIDGEEVGSTDHDCDESELNVLQM